MGEISPNTARGRPPVASVGTMPSSTDAREALLARIAGIEAVAPVSARLLREFAEASDEGGALDRATAVSALAAALFELEARRAADARACTCGRIAAPVA